MRLGISLLLLVVVVSVASLLSSLQLRSEPNAAATFVASTTRIHTQTIEVATTTPTATTTTVVGSTTRPMPKATTTAKKAVNKPEIQDTLVSVPAQVEQPKPLYTSPPQSFDLIDNVTRAALVNILCMPQGGTLRPISGSGVIIDSRGVILTNAHVAQYVLLSQSPQVNLVCTIKTGSPAQSRWKAAVLYIPPVWVQEHYKEINANRVSGTGEHDYALLVITTDTQGNTTSGPFPYLPVDVREEAAVVGDSVLGAGYPAEFVGGIMAQQGLYAVTSISNIKQLLTFQATTIDMFSIGGVIEAQGGASGGPVVNAWRYVIGIIATTSDGATTAQRDLHALSLNYINRDIVTQSGRTLEVILSRNPTEDAISFSRETAAALIQKYIDYLSR